MENVKNNIMADNYIGIDPDVEKNGVALVERKTKKLEVTTLTFSELMDYISFIKRVSERDAITYRVVIEAGWLNKSNWHLHRGFSIAKAAEVGRATGRNHQTGILIAEMCDYLGVPYVLRKPLHKVWQGKDGKITAKELSVFTGLRGRTNQEGRDAALLAWCEAGLPIKISPSQKITEK